MLQQLKLKQIKINNKGDEIIMNINKYDPDYIEAVYKWLDEIPEYRGFDDIPNNSNVELEDDWNKWYRQDNEI